MIPRHQLMLFLFGAGSLHDLELSCAPRTRYSVLERVEGRSQLIEVAADLTRLLNESQAGDVKASQDYPA